MQDNANFCLQALARRMVSVINTRGTHVSEQGDEAENVYFLQRGTVEVLHLGRPVGRLYAPATFGEAALLRDEMELADTRLSGFRTTSKSLCALLAGQSPSLYADGVACGGSTCEDAAALLC